MPSRRILVTASILSLILVAAVPVEATPALQRGAHSSYALSASISFLRTCDMLGTTAPSGVVVCPMTTTLPMSTNISGTIDWAVTDLTSTAASLNVTRNLAISNGDSTRPIIASVGSFNESIDLATRLVSLFPSIMPEMDQFLQIAQTTTAANLPGISLTTSMPTLESIMPHHLFYTMWWVNGPLKLNETIPVLVLPTNVTRATSVALGGSLGTREAWALTFNFSRAMSDPVPATPSDSLISDNLQLSFVFDYDKTSDILLSAATSVHLGFQNEIILPPTSCVPSGSTVCPATSGPTSMLTSSGLSIEAALRLSSTTVDLSQRISQTVPLQDNGGSESSGGSNNGSGSGTNGGSSGGNIGVSSNPGNNGATGSIGQPSSNSNQPGNGGQLMGLPVWIYDLLGAFAVIVIGAAMWFSRRRLKKSVTNNRSKQTSS